MYFTVIMWRHSSTGRNLKPEVGLKIVFAL